MTGDCRDNGGAYTDPGYWLLDAGLSECGIRITGKPEGGCVLSLIAGRL